MQNDLAEMSEMHSALGKLMETWKRLNGGVGMPEFQTTEASFAQLFFTAAELAKELERHLDEFGSQRTKLGGTVQAMADWLIEIQEKLSGIDEISGFDKDIINRFKMTKVV